MTQKRSVLLSDAVHGKHYPSLDGLRAVAIILVICRHLNFQPLTIFNGALGVDIFFVLSGFLITSLCIKEKSETGSISLKNFYIRRSLRIFPVAYLYLLTLGILNKLFHLDIVWFQFLGAGFYLMNASYFRSHNFSWFTGHYWSLAVEEQFYLLFPYLLKKQSKFYYGFVLFIIFALPLICYIQYLIPDFNKGIFYAFTHYFIKFQGIAVGCLFGILAFNKSFDKYMISINKLGGNVIALLLIFVLNYNDFFTIHSMFTNCLISLLLGYVIMSNIIPSNDIIYKTFNWKPLRIIGKLSYSIYIWQQLFTSNSSKLPFFFSRYPYNVFLIIAAACCSYYFYESYFLKLKSQFKWSANQVDSANKSLNSRV